MFSSRGARSLVCLAVVYYLCTVGCVHGQTDDEDATQGSGDVSCTATGCQGDLVCNDASGQCECPSGFILEYGTNSTCTARTTVSTYQLSNTVLDNSFTYSSDLEDPNSATYNQYEETWCNSIDEVYENSELDYSGCDVTSFEQGSVIVNYVIYVKENSSQPLNASQIQDVIRTSTVADNCTARGINRNSSDCYRLGSLVVTSADRFIQATQDYNECLDSKIHGCNQNANCTDTQTSYYCTCLSGFSGDGFTCTAIVEGLKLESTAPVCLERVKYILIFVNSVLLASFVILLVACISTKRKADLVDTSLFSY